MIPVIAGIDLKYFLLIANLTMGRTNRLMLSGPEFLWVT